MDGTSPQGLVQAPLLSGGHKTPMAFFNILSIEKGLVHLHLEVHQGVSHAEDIEGSRPVHWFFRVGFKWAVPGPYSPRRYGNEKLGPVLSYRHHRPLPGDPPSTLSFRCRTV